MQHEHIYFLPISYFHIDLNVKFPNDLPQEKQMIPSDQMLPPVTLHPDTLSCIPGPLSATGDYSSILGPT